MSRMKNRPEEDHLEARLHRHAGAMNKATVAAAEALTSALEPKKKKMPSSTEDSRRREFYEKLVRATKSKYEKAAAEYQGRKKARTEYERIVEKTF